MDDATTQAVRQQYEEFPYPTWDPQRDQEGRYHTHLNTLEVMNHYCFQGRRNFLDDFTVLVAGGGTGDSTLWLARQLLGTDATIIHLDISETSAAIARQRAQALGLDNITWMHGSLLDVGGMDLPKFDYVNCAGVLHHLKDPAGGLAALRSVLKDDGAMGLMVYGRYGRAGVYQMQDLMRLINGDEDEGAAKVARTRAVLASLPPTNWFKRAEELVTDHQWQCDAGVYDLFLHSQDRPYSVGEVYELLDSCRLHLVEFGPAARSLYRPETFLTDPALLAGIAEMPLRRRQAIGELLSGAVTKHSFWACPRADPAASIDDLENIPLFIRPGTVDTSVAPQEGKAVTWTFRSPLPLVGDLVIRPGRCAWAVCKHINGRRSLKEIIRLVSKDFAVRPSRNEILAEFQPIFEHMRQWGDLILLRHPDSRLPSRKMAPS